MCHRLPSRFLVLHFEIGERGLAARAPVDDVVAAIDESLFVQAHEGFAHGAREAGIEREAFARPVATDAGALHLLDDASAVFLFPLPDAGLEGIAAEVALGQAFRGELALHHDLRGDACMIGAGQPQRVDGFSIGVRFMRRQRTWASMMECSNMCPMCREPVTFGGGIASEK